MLAIIAAVIFAVAFVLKVAGTATNASGGRGGGGDVGSARHGQVVARSGEADVQGEVPDPQVEYSAAGPVHDERQQDDGQDYDDHPEEEHDDAGDGIPGYSSRFSHGHLLPTAARLIRRRGCGGGRVSICRLVPGAASTGCRARSRRYLNPTLRCLRRSRRRHMALLPACV